MGELILLGPWIFRYESLFKLIVVPDNTFGRVLRRACSRYNIQHLLFDSSSVVNILNSKYSTLSLSTC